MKTFAPVLLPVLFVSFLGGTMMAQQGDNYAKLGAAAFILSDGQKANHHFLSLGASVEHQFSSQFSGNLHVNAARLVGDAAVDSIEGYIRNINSLETELRFYPNKKGKGFYAGASLLWYRDKRVIGTATKKAGHLGSHINAGFQYPLHHNFYLQINGQAGIYGKGYATISRYGLNAMVGKRF